MAAHEAVLDRVDDPEVRETAEVFLKVMRFEAEEWEQEADESRRSDTLFFWCA
ncbi:hypothetical protein [Streptomyces sp. NBC_00091]|uniref:hypothetical protein n=1 Tax=Streptomyces sp. NBC_00091 TaxID=2975648 RepID=UPI002259D822|nr:hypothetical protein [Streptomyces sp. NBC_00091]MCX5380022.1 hypothetical protein [Streptomyces sp. NBC_00091]